MPDRPRHVLFVFLDGVGLGADEAETNPLTHVLPSFASLSGGQAWIATARPINQRTHVFHGIDANLGIEGLPQSGTGQATLLTGVNCAHLAGRHFGPFPHSKTRPVLATANVFERLKALDLPFEQPSAFANAYPPRFFTYVQKRDRWTVTTRCCLEADVPIRGYQDLLAGDALAADLTGATWPERLGLPLMPISETEAGKRLVRLHERHAFTLFEYFLTDKAGHSRDRSRTDAVLQSLDHFFQGLLSHLDLRHSLLVVTSDHGNLEDLSTKSHTHNPVPLVAYGCGADRFSSVEDLTGVTPAIVGALKPPDR